YISAPGFGLLAKRVGSTPFWIHTDQLGSVQAITNGSGDVVQRRTYRPYGGKLADATSHVESRGFIEQRQDPETGLTYLHARYYDPDVALFLSPDPLAPQAGLNAYGYAGGNPITVSDPSGLDGIVVGCGDNKPCDPDSGDDGEFHVLRPGL